MPGKADWLARRLPTERAEGGPRAGDVARDDVVTARLDERVGDVRARVESSRYGFALVVTENRTLLGRLRKSALADDPDAVAGDVLEPGPSTVRADTSVEELLGKLREQELRTALVTTPEGVLIGVVLRTDLER